MIILSFQFRGSWFYGVIFNPPRLDFPDGAFDYQSKNIFTLYLDTVDKNVRCFKNASPEVEAKIRSKYEGDSHYSAKMIEDIVRSAKVKSSFRLVQNLFLQVRAIYTNAEGWRYETVYTENDITNNGYYDGIHGVECRWAENMFDVAAVVKGEK